MALASFTFATGAGQTACSVLISIAAWASARPDAIAIGLVGSWARNEAGADSDLDLVVLTENPGAYVEDEGWVAELGARCVVRTKRWGAIAERRIVLASGLELDVGIAEPSWAATTPVDPGTRRVVAGGMLILHDPDGLLRALVAACQQPPGKRDEQARRALVLVRARRDCEPPAQEPG